LPFSLCFSIVLASLKSAFWQVCGSFLTIIAAICRLIGGWTVWIVVGIGWLFLGYFR
jgi:hypothetical protein